ncbi:hypothetical protein ELH88_01385 [Rhizobium ruizarguesonis]|nr:hypothetical protein ELH87_01385 [Rhizobium ruizarguesonis]TAY55899.1 hypothetical protein ELH88_01385 [Rhizobium ruizarguesonis]
MWSPFVLSKQTESQLADFTQLFFGQAHREWGSATTGPGTAPAEASDCLFAAAMRPESSSSSLFRWPEPARQSLIFLIHVTPCGPPRSRGDDKQAIASGA